MKDLYDIEPVSARAVVAVEEGKVEAIVDSYMFEFTVQEYSNGGLTVLLDSNTKKARTVLKKYGATFQRSTKDEVHGESFKKRIQEIYGYSNSRGGMSCSWTTEDYDKLQYKELI